MPDKTVMMNFAGEPDPAREIMSARDAMRETIERAQIGDMEGASLWVRIAAELRQGEWMSASVKGVPLASGGVVRGPITGETTKEWIAKQIRMKRVAPSPHALDCPCVNCSLRRSDTFTLTPGEDDTADQIVDYRRGQDAPPSDKATSYARARVRALDAGMGAHHPDERSLLDEILQRADGDTQVMQVPIPRTVADIGDGSSMDSRQCKSCILDVQWIDGAGWTHDVPGYIVACPMDMAYRR